MTYILILFVTMGAISSNDSMALINVPGFTSKVQCEQAGKIATAKFGTGTKRSEFVCVEQSK